MHASSFDEFTGGSGGPSIPRLFEEGIGTICVASMAWRGDSLFPNRAVVPAAELCVHATHTHHGLSTGAVARDGEDGVLHYAWRSSFDPVADGDWTVFHQTAAMGQHTVQSLDRYLFAFVVVSRWWDHTIVTVVKRVDPDLFGSLVVELGNRLRGPSVVSLAVDAAEVRPEADMTFCRNRTYHASHATDLMGGVHAMRALQGEGDLITRQRELLEMVVAALEGDSGVEASLCSVMESDPSKGHVLVVERHGADGPTDLLVVHLNFQHI